MIKVHWQGGMAFAAEVSGGKRFIMDASVQSGGKASGPSPLEAFLSAAAACSGMDVVLILGKKRVKFDEYWIEVEWTRAPEGSHPRPVLSVEIRHMLRGKDLDEKAVAKAVTLSDQKYCAVASTLRQSPEVKSTYEIVP
jgi:putative redox protein